MSSGIEALAGSDPSEEVDELMFIMASSVAG